MKIDDLLEKYKTRKEECEEKFDEDVISLKQTTDANRKKYLTEDMMCLNSQIGTYECIIKDLKEYLDEVSRRI
jgi:polyhydroxyalkanoate synthesis regulator phasin